MILLIDYIETIHNGDRDEFGEKYGYHPVAIESAVRENAMYEDGTIYIPMPKVHTWLGQQ